LRREGDLAAAEVGVVVFDEAGEKIGEGVFAADADGPSRARLVRDIGTGARMSAGLAGLASANRAAAPSTIIRMTAPAW
jgi:hypothetical protein